MHIPRILIAGTHSGSGKTSVSAAIMGAYTRRGLHVRPFKAGPDYIDPAFHSFITGHPSRNLDSWILSAQALHTIFLKASGPTAACGSLDNLSTCDPHHIALIEGVMGLFDGSGSGHEGSSAHLAQLLRLPIVLVIDAKGMSRSAAALIQGYASYLPELGISGVICNRTSGQKHYALLRAVIEDTGIPCFGHLPYDASYTLKDRKLGLIPAQEVSDIHTRLERLSQAAEEYMDLDGLLSLAASAPHLNGAVLEEYPDSPENDTAPPYGGIPSKKADSSPSRHVTSHTASRVRLGIARDAAFSFYYQDNLDMLNALGADLVPFSPLTDTVLPEGLHGLYLGGGFPAEFACELETNIFLRQAINTALEGGLPCYAECGGMLYLTRSIQMQDGESHAMSGFLPGKAYMEKRLQHFGYGTVTLLQNSLLGPSGLTFRGHEFHYSKIIWDEQDNNSYSLPSLPVKDTPCDSAKTSGQAPLKATTHCNAIYPAYQMVKPDGTAWTGGILLKNTLAIYPHLHFFTLPDAAEHFIATCRNYALSV